MRIVRNESHSSEEKCVIEDSERTAVEYARCEMLLESLEWAIEHDANIILQRHSMGLTRRLVHARMLAIENEIRAARTPDPQESK